MLSNECFSIIECFSKAKILESSWWPSITTCLNIYIQKRSIYFDDNLNPPLKLICKQKPKEILVVHWCFFCLGSFKMVFSIWTQQVIFQADISNNYALSTFEITFSVDSTCSFTFFFISLSLTLTSWCKSHTLSLCQYINWSHYTLRGHSKYWCWHAPCLS